VLVLVLCAGYSLCADFGFKGFIESADGYYTALEEGSVPGGEEFERDFSLHWEQFSKFLSVSVRQATVDEVSVAVERAVQAFRAGEREEAATALRELLTRLRHLQESERIDFFRVL